ncbi:hypothetical protein K6L09_46485, partial [Burkholderia cepacia]
MIATVFTVESSRFSMMAGTPSKLSRRYVPERDRRSKRHAVGRRGRMASARAVNGRPIYKPAVTRRPSCAQSRHLAAASAPAARARNLLR